LAILLLSRIFDFVCCLISCLINSFTSHLFSIILSFRVFPFLSSDNCRLTGPIHVHCKSCRRDGRFSGHFEFVFCNLLCYSRQITNCHTMC
jgi:hypothetical protein